jgi:hypothetical protein
MNQPQNGAGMNGTQEVFYPTSNTDIRGNPSTAGNGFALNEAMQYAPQTGGPVVFPPYNGWEKCGTAPGTP